MNVELRPALLPDLDRIVALERDNFSVPWPREGFEAELNCPESVFLAAENDGVICGFVILRLADYEAEVYNIAVDSACRRHGVGGRLLDAALKEAAQRGAVTVYLEVRASNKAAIKLYSSRGFVPVGLRRAYYDKPKEDAVIMTVSLESVKEC